MQEDCRVVLGDFGGGRRRRLTVVLVLSPEFAEATIDIILRGRRSRRGHVICSIRIGVRFRFGDWSQDQRENIINTCSGAGVLVEGLKVSGVYDIKVGGGSGWFFILYLLSMQLLYYVVVVVGSLVLLFTYIVKTSSTHRLDGFLVHSRQTQILIKTHCERSKKRKFCRKHSKQKIKTEESKEFRTKKSNGRRELSKANVRTYRR